MTLREGEQQTWGQGVWAWEAWREGLGKVVPHSFRGYDTAASLLQPSVETLLRHGLPQLVSYGKEGKGLSSTLGPMPGRGKGTAARVVLRMGTQR